MAESPTSSDATASGVAASGVAASDTTASDVAASDTTTSDATASGVAASGVAASDTTASDVAASDTTTSDATASDALASDALASDVAAPSDALAMAPVSLKNMVDITKLFPIVVTYTDGAKDVSDECGNTYLFKDRWVCANNPDLVCSVVCSFWEWVLNRESYFKGWPEPWYIPNWESPDYKEYMEKHSNECAFRVDHVTSECFTTRQVLNSEVRHDKYGTRTYVFRGKVYVNGGKENYFVVYMTLCSAAEDDCFTLFSDIDYRGFIDDVVDGFNPYDMCVHKVQKNGYGDDDSVWKLGPRT
jgi:hypothetical protein